VAMTASESRINSILGEFLRDLVKQETISAVGLYGSWGRYEASPQSDVDLLIVDRRSFDYKYLELLDHGDLLIDILRIPRKWIDVTVNPEVDHVLFESIVLHDPEGVLERAREWVAENYRTPGRIDVRTEHNLILSDSYLSRATSAMLRGDWESAAVYAAFSMDPGVEVLIDIASLPVTEISFIWNLRRASEGLGLLGLYRTYLSTARLTGLKADDISSSIKAFEESWRLVSSFMEENRRVVERVHRRLRNEISYRTTSTYLKAVLARVRRVVEERNYMEAGHYLRGNHLRLLEEFSEISARKRGRKFDYPSLFKSLREDEEIYRHAVEIFDLRELDEGKAKEAIESARSVISYIRRNRKELIAKHL